MEEKTDEKKDTILKDIVAALKDIGATLKSIDKKLDELKQIRESINLRFGRK